MVLLTTLQHEVAQWAQTADPVNSLLTIGVQVGELNHATLAQRFGVDESREESKAIGGIIVYLLDYCEKRGLVLEDVLTKEWNAMKWGFAKPPAMHPPAELIEFGTNGDPSSTRQVNPTPRNSWDGIDGRGVKA